ncbi:hypothetical protein D3C78_20360 [compost metagenome]
MFLADVKRFIKEATGLSMQARMVEATLDENRLIASETIRIYDTVSSYELSVNTCVDPSQQEEYEQRLILSELGIPIEDKPLIVFVTKNEKFLFFENANMVCICQDATYHIDGSRIEQAYNYSSVIGINRLAVEIINDRLTLVEPSPWLNSIKLKLDLYRNPTSVKLTGKTHIPYHPNTYCGADLWVIDSKLAFINLEKIWVRSDVLWLENMLPQLSDQIQNEYTMYKNLQSETSLSF